MKLRRFFKKWHDYSPIFTMVVAFLFPITLLLHVLSICFEPVANFVNRYPARGIRFLLAKVTGIFPFSLAEIVIFLLIPLTAVAIVLAFRLCRKEDPKPSRYFLSYLISFLMLLYCGFVLTLGTSYFTTTLDRELSLEKKGVSAKELYAVTEQVVKEMNTLLDEITFDESGHSVMPYSYDELNEKLNAAYKTFTKEYSFVASLSSNVKGILVSEPLTYTHLSGIYTYFTGEANVNTNFPDSTLAFTMAHEMAHQRGIGREDEANFIAFLVAMSSDDSYIRYSGYYEMFKYLVNALYSADKELFKKAYEIADERLYREIVAFNDFYEKYQDNLAADIAGSINDSYQQMQGVEAGIKSYGLVVDLAVAYYHKYESFFE